MGFLEKPAVGPEAIQAHENTLRAGVLSIAVLHTLCNVALLSIMYTLLRPAQRSLAHFYWGNGLLSTLLLALGSIALLPLLEISATSPGELSGALPFLVKFHQFTYQAGMALWGLGGLVFCYLLHRSALVPRGFPVVGYFAYALFLAGTLLALLGKPPGLWTTLPGGLLELTLSVWFILRGLR